MRKVECYRSDSGSLEDSLDRAKAGDLLHALPKSSTNPNSKVLDWSDCMRIMDHADIVAEHVGEFIRLRDFSNQ